MKIATQCRWVLTLVLVVLAYGSGSPAWAQDETGRFVGSHGTSYFYRAWTRDSGLPQDMVADIAQTREGYLWITTFGGLVRFDGTRFHTFDLAGEPGLVSSSMTALYADPMGALWIGHNVEGLNRYLGGRFTAYTPQNGLPGGKVWAITQDAEGALWVGTSEGLAVRRDGNPLEGPDLPVPGPVLSLLADRRGGLWVGTGDGLWHRPAGLAYLERIEDVPSTVVYELIEDADGMLWMATQVGLMRRRHGSWQLVLDSPCTDVSQWAPSISRLALDRRGGLWLSSCSNRERPSSTRLHYFPSHQRTAALPITSEVFDLGGLPVTSLWVDRQDGLWLGTHGNGLYNLRSQPVKRWMVEDGLPARELRTVLGDGENGVWIAADCNAPLTHFRDGSFGYYPTDANGEDLGCVGGLARGRDGDLWIGSRGDLVRLHGETVIERHVLFEEIDEMVLNTVLEDRAGDLWVGSNGQGLVRVVDGEITLYSRDHGLMSNYVHFLAQDGEGTLWIGTNDGLNRFDGDRFIGYGRDDGLPPGMVRAIHEDHDGGLWIGTYGGGLARLRDGELTRITMDDGLFDNVVTRILEDARGNFWMLGNLGLSFVHRDQLNAFADGDLESVFSISFGVAEGMIEGSGARQPAGWRTNDGKMWFPTIDGLAMIDADNFELDRVSLPVHIEKAVIEDRTVAAVEPIDMAAGERDLEIHYTAPSFAAPQKVRFRYQLVGYDKAWNQAGSRRVAYYTNLPPGAYTFRVVAANRHGVWAERPTTLRVRVRPPWWRSWQAYGLYALAFGLVLVGSVRWQQRRIESERSVNRRLRQVDRLKDDFLANTSHELRTPLYGMVGLAEALLDGAGGELSGTSRSYLETLVASGRRLGSLVDDILDFSRLRHQSLALDLGPVDLHAATDVVLTLSRPLIAGRDLELVNAIGTDLPAVWADEDRVQQILHNLVGNAVKFTESGTVEVSARSEGNVVEVAVADTGIGIAPDRAERIFDAFEQGDSSVSRSYGGTGLGLAVTRQLVELHQGRIRAESIRGQGSTFFFTLPVAQQGEIRASKAGVAPVAQQALAEAAASPASTTASTSAAAEREPILVARPGVPSSAAADKGRARVLVVDDEPVNRQVLVSQLTTRGYLAEAVASGAEALHRLRSQSFDLVILDVMMPNMSGFEVCRSLRERHSPEELPVIFLTARNRDSDLVAGLAAGGNDYLAKPVGRDELVARVRTQLGLLSAHRRLRAQNAELTRFNYTVAHDLKNPLTTILNYLGRARSNAAAGQERQLERDFDRLDAAAQRLRRLLDELFELSRVGIRRLEPQAVMLEELVREALAELAGAITERGIEVTVTSGLPTVRGDRALLLEVFRRLLANAVQYLGEQPAPRIVVGLRERSGETVVTVRDNGIGIEPKYHDKVFGLFERLAPEVSEGTGIGLALVRRIVELHGGRVWVESAGIGHGSELCIGLW